MNCAGGRWVRNKKKWRKLDYVQSEEVTKSGCSIIDGINPYKKRIKIFLAILGWLLAKLDITSTLGFRCLGKTPPLFFLHHFQGAKEHPGKWILGDQP